MSVHILPIAGSHRPVFLVNSCLGHFSAAMEPPPWPYLFRSYVCILPSSLTRVSPCAYAFSACPPVSVCSTVPRCISLGAVSWHDGCPSFAHPWMGSLPAQLRSGASLRPSQPRRFARDYQRPGTSRPMLHSIGPSGGTGMLTRFPSATPFGLALGAG